MAIQIGEVSKRTQLKIETIRYYEKEKLVSAPPRSRGGRRQYDEPHILRLSFIKRCRALGFSLKEVRVLLGLVDGGYTCSQVEDIVRRHQQAIQAKIADLKKLDETLEQMAKQCTGNDVSDCAVIDLMFASRN